MTMRFVDILHEKRGDITILLTFLAIGVILIGTAASTRLAQQGTNIAPKASERVSSLSSTSCGDLPTTKGDERSGSGCTLSTKPEVSFECASCISAHQSGFREWWDSVGHFSCNNIQVVSNWRQMEPDGKRNFYHGHTTSETNSPCRCFCARELANPDVDYSDSPPPEATEAPPQEPTDEPIPTDIPEPTEVLPTSPPIGYTPPPGQSDEDEGDNPDIYLPQDYPTEVPRESVPTDEPAFTYGATETPIPQDNSGDQIFPTDAPPSDTDDSNTPSDQVTSTGPTIAPFSGERIVENVKKVQSVLVDTSKKGIETGKTTVVKSGNWLWTVVTNFLNAASF